MPIQRQRFTVLMVMDRDKYGYDEHTLPPLIALMDSAAPDVRTWTHTGPTGHFLTSPDSLVRIQRVIEQFEQLRTSDSRFDRLGIGLAEGEMSADFTSLGVLKTEAPPLGLAAQHAYRRAETGDGYHETLGLLGAEFSRTT
jgi:hypothetical protein